MDILYLLIPFSVVLLLIIVGVFGWAVYSGQFEDVDEQARHALWDDEGEPGGEHVPGQEGQGAGPGARQNTTT